MDKTREEVTEIFSKFVKENNLTTEDLIKVVECTMREVNARGMKASINWSFFVPYPEYPEEGICP